MGRLDALAAPFSDLGLEVCLGVAVLPLFLRCRRVIQHIVHLHLHDQYAP